MVRRLVLVVAVAVALAGCTGSTTGGQSAKAHRRCTLPAPLGRPPMPAPQRLSSTLAFGFNHIRLYPPPRNVTPRVSAAKAWDAVVRTSDSAQGLDLNGTYKLILADWNSTDPTAASTNPKERLLVWLVIGKHILVSTLLRGTHITAPVCIYESAMWPLNATTGLLYGEMTYPPTAEVLH